MGILRLVVLVLVILALQSCSERAWYDGFQNVREQECYNLQGNQREECLRNADVNYDRYQKDRKEVCKEGSK